MVPLLLQASPSFAQPTASAALHAAEERAAYARLRLLHRARPAAVPWPATRGGGLGSRGGRGGRGTSGRGGGRGRGSAADRDAQVKAEAKKAIEAEQFKADVEAEAAKMRAAKSATSGNSDGGTDGTTGAGP